MNAPTNLDRSAGLFEEIAPEAWSRGSALAIELLEIYEKIQREHASDRGKPAVRP